MINYPLLRFALLLVPIVLCADENAPTSGPWCGQQLACFARDTCKGDPSRNMLKEVYQTPCNVHLQLKRYNQASYLVRLITTVTQELSIVRSNDGASFGCKVKDSKMTTTQSDGSIKTTLLNSSVATLSGDVTMCEFVATQTNGDLLPNSHSNQKLTLVYNSEKLTLEMSTVATELNSLKNQCDALLIEKEGADFEEGGYFAMKVDARLEHVTCPPNYDIAFVNAKKEIETAAKIECVESDKVWQYTITPKERTTQQSKPRGPFKAACRRKACQLCSKPSLKCVDAGCKLPLFVDGGDGCHSLKCDPGKTTSIAKVDGASIRAIGNFECAQVGKDKKVPNFAWLFNGAQFTSAACFDEIDCHDHKAIFCDEKKSECPKRDILTFALTCSNERKIELVELSGEKRHPGSAIQCNRLTGVYQYTTEDGITTIDPSRYASVACAKKEKPAPVPTGMPIWQIGAIAGGGVIVLVIIIILLCFFRRRSHKKSEERAALLKNKVATHLHSASQRPSSSSSDPPPKRVATPTPIPAPPRVVQLVDTKEAEGKKKIPSAEKKKVVVDCEDPSKVTEKSKSIKEAKSPSLDLSEQGGTRKEKSGDSSRRMAEGAPSGKNTLKSNKDETKKANETLPRKFELNEKEKQIAKGKMRKNEDYPTMADVMSDWDDEKDVKKPGKKTTTIDIPTANAPSPKNDEELMNEKTAEVDRLINEPEMVSKQSARPANKKKTNTNTVGMPTALEETQEQKW